MLPTTETDGQPHRDLTTFRVHDNERVLIASESPNGEVHELCRVQENGRFGVIPLPQSMEDSIVDVTKLEGDIDVSEMRIIGEAIGLKERGAATIELRVDGEPISDFNRPGAYGLFWVPVSD